MAKAIKIDWDKEEKTEGGRRPRLPEGDYVATVKSVEPFTSSNNNPGLLWKFTVSDGKYSGKELWDRTMLMPKNLWSVRRILENLGVKVPESGMQQLPLSKIKGREIGLTVVDGEPFENKISSEIADYLEAEVVRSGGVDDEEDELDEDDELEEDEEDEDEADDLEGMDRSELKTYIKEEGLGVKVTKKMSDDAIRQAIQDLEDEEEEDEEEDLEELDLDDL